MATGFDQLMSKLELDGVRRDAEPLFVDEGRFFRPTGTETYDRATDSFIGSNTSNILYEGRCSFYSMLARRDRFDEQGQGLIFIRQSRVIVPWEVANIQVRDLFQLLSTEDPYLLGRVFEVRDVIGNTNNGYRRVTVHDPRE